MKKKIVFLVALLVFAGLIAEVYHWINELPEVRSALISDKDKPKPVTNDWRMALLESINEPVVGGIKASVESTFDRFELNLMNKQISAVDNVLSRFNWPDELSKGADNAPASAYHVHIKHLPNRLPFWKKKGSDIIIIPLVAQGKYGLAAGFLAIHRGNKTIAGLRFFHSEDTPGLGQKVLKTEFTQTFVGKPLFDNTGVFALKIMRAGKADNANKYEIDGISGATMMSNGVQDAFAFWTGADAYGALFK